MLPAFYVNVIFINTGQADVWVGGKPRTNFVRIVVEQIARKLLSEETEGGVAQRTWWMDRINVASQRGDMAGHGFPESEHKGMCCRGLDRERSWGGCERPTDLSELLGTRTSHTGAAGA